MGGAMKNRAASDPLIGVEELSARLAAAESNLVLLDATVDLPSARFDGDYRVASGRASWLAERIPGSRHADLTIDLADTSVAYSFAHPAAQAIKPELIRLGLSDDSHVIIYDSADGFWAARLWWTLRSLGFASSVLDGGLAAWREAGLALTHGEANQGGFNAACGELTLQEQPACWVDRSRIEAVVAGQATGLLVCALSKPVFDGSAFTRYARRGHIPGSRNLPARSLFDARGRYLRGRALSTAIATAIASHAAPRPWLLYCGGGISASAAALGLTLNGETDIAIYDGSIQEWAADPALPLVTTDLP